MMDWYEPEVHELERSARQDLLPENPAVFYGSSSMRLWDSMAQDLSSNNLVNRGFGGSTLEACAYFFERLIPPLHPASLTVYAGDNDLGDGKSPEEVLSFFRMLRAKFELHLCGKPFAYMSIKPSPARAGIIDKIRATNDLIRQDMQTFANSYFIDIFSFMLGPDSGPRKELFGEDGLHINRRGYEIWVNQLKPYRKRLFIEPTLDQPILKLISSELESGVSQVAQPMAKP